MLDCVKCKMYGVFLKQEYHIVNPLAKAYQNKRPKTSHAKEEKKGNIPLAIFSLMVGGDILL